ncbi:hypothetical protein Tcan_17459, partial [Toxocara canis]
LRIHYGSHQLSQDFHDTQDSSPILCCVDRQTHILTSLSSLYRQLIAIRTIARFVFHFVRAIHFWRFTIAQSSRTFHKFTAISSHANNHFLFPFCSFLIVLACISLRTFYHCIVPKCSLQSTHFECLLSGAIICQADYSVKRFCTIFCSSSVQCSSTTDVGWLHQNLPPNGSVMFVSFNRIRTQGGKGCEDG